RRVPRLPLRHEAATRSRFHPAAATTRRGCRVGRGAHRRDCSLDTNGGAGDAMTKAKLELQHDGRIARVILAAPKANILDGTMISELDSIFETLQTRRELRAIVLEAE